jgi:hypothetical protein
VFIYVTAYFHLCRDEVAISLIHFTYICIHGVHNMDT